MAPSSDSPECPVCRGAARESYRLPDLSGAAAALRVCGSCGFAFLDAPAGEPSPYEGEYYCFRPWMEPLNRRAARCRWRELEPLLPGRRLIDVGCGQGFLLAEAARAGWSARGVEPNPAAAEQARREAGAEVRVAHLEELDDWDASADAVTAFDVIEHAADPVDFLRRVRRLLAPGGAAVVETPNFGCLSRRLMGPAWYGFNPYHVSLFTPAALALAARRAGLRVLWTRTPHVGLGQAALRLLYDAGWRVAWEVARGGRRDAVYAGAPPPPRDPLRRLAGFLVYRRGPWAAAAERLGWGDKLRAALARDDDREPAGGQG